MKRITSVMLAAMVASASFSTSAQAADSTVPYWGSFDFGDQVVSIPALSASSGAFVFDTRFHLEHDSVLTGVLTGISSGAVTLTETWFSELRGQIESRTLARSIVFDGQPFDLGTQPGTAGVISISPSMYRISLSGTLSDAARLTGAGFTLSVSPAVPEPTSLALMGLGLAGVAAVRRQRAQQA
ncbi:MAG: PEP-CTERM sorting domain-containing protein [Aquabacterium sp.]|uniref:PEP-CTERM sorting domain-containing protein n=1 Tax=Aquabacterium sp. TaxID=1872578 RepID=UPI0025C65096|nr:PEP-CTERM sorting domain-containing protein [Aquabacterium sp.]MBI5924352.1 PEP-CTERM sorting domain-containing protein [Aquabacterium sp.]